MHQRPGKAFLAKEGRERYMTVLTSSVNYHRILGQGEARMGLDFLFFLECY